MPNPAPQIKHLFADAKPPLSELARFAVEGLHAEEGTYRYVKENGPEAARQLLRYLTDLLSAVGCTSVEQFVMGYAARTDEPETARLTNWGQILGRAFDLAMIEDPDKKFQGDGTRDFAEIMFPLMRDAAVIASPLLVAWGNPAKT